MGSIPFSRDESKACAAVESLTGSRKTVSKKRGEKTQNANIFGLGTPGTRVGDMWKPAQLGFLGQGGGGGPSLKAVALNAEDPPQWGDFFLSRVW